MLITLQVRSLAADGLDTVRQLAHSRTAAARAAERAKVIWLAHRGWSVPAIAREVGLDGGAMRLWLTRFDADGVDGLRDRPRAGRPPTYTAEEAGEVVALSLTDPKSLDPPCASRTRDRLAAYLHAAEHVPMSRARIGKLLAVEGSRRRTRETWFGERVDPAAAERGGRRRGDPLLERPSPSLHLGQAAPPPPVTPPRHRPHAESGVDLRDGPLSRSTATGC